MSKDNKATGSAFERRVKIYEKYGLKPTLVHKTGVAVILSYKPIRKEDK